MKKTLLILTLLFIFNFNSFGNDRHSWTQLINAIAKVESEYNPKAVSKNGKYVGYLQISKIIVDDCNRILGKNVYCYKHRYDKAKSIEMFIIIQRHYNSEKDIEKAIRLWNGGPTYDIQKTQEYYDKVIYWYNNL